MMLIVLVFGFVGDHYVHHYVVLTNYNTIEKCCVGIFNLNRRLALKWHPDKHGGDSAVTTKFQEINEAYNVLSDPAKRLDYDLTGICEIEKYSLQEYLARFKGMILTCNGLGISQTDRWSPQLIENFESLDK
ncbi:dnaJ homolog shv-like [Vigna umbellata]|uniref:dnaJ homolog shv-like n=1 Tax=Vigna umbellata TaxID=87088 RepID=UPI001F5EF09D|nr:dnaJ homolog shv-like [Vigna umbellata]